MYLKRLEIVGFKSFTERVVVPFSPGISSVVGPNGCGKSNIIDAIRWVMGEQSPRHLRARNMEDILFNGSRGRAPAALAEVTLVLTRELDNQAGLAEVGVTRRLYRGGDSEYLINKSPSRLKDVLRFFMEAGMGTRAYNIIEQEKVGRLVDARPEDRRLLLDEAAGIVRFKEQKKESERKIESAERNLTAAEAILAETKKQLTEVARAAARASKHQALKTELRELELALAARRFLALRERLTELTEELAAGEGTLTDLSAATAQAELEVERLRLEEVALERSLEDELAVSHGLQNALETHRLEKEHAQETLADARGRRERAQEDLAGLERDQERHEVEREELAQSIASLQAESQEAGQRRDSLREKWLVVKTNLDKLARERDEAGARLETTRERTQLARETLAGAESLMEHLREREKALGLEKNQGDLALAEARERLAARQRFKDQLAEDLRAREEELGERREDVEVAREELEAGLRRLGQADSEMAALAARLATLEDLKSGFSWYPAGVRALMEEPSLREALLGPVAERLEAPEGFEAAVEAALGERLAWILARDKAGAASALNFARANNLGRSGFVAWSEVQAGDLLKTLLGEYELREDLSQLEGGPALTRTGEYVGPGFLVGGGSGGGETGEDQGLLARLKEVAAAEDKLDDLKRAYDQEKAKVDHARENRLRAESALAASQGALDGLRGDLAEANSKIMVAQSEEKGLAIRLQSLDGEIAEAQARMTEAEAKRGAAAAERDSLAGELAGLETEFQELKRAAGELEEELADIQEQGQLAAKGAETAAERLDSAQKALRGAEEWLDSLESRRLTLFNDAEILGQQIDNLTSKLADLETAAAGLPEKLAAAERVVQELRVAREEGRVAAAKIEEQARETRKRREEAAKAHSVLEKEFRELEHRLGNLTADLLKDWRITLIDPVEEARKQAAEAERLAAAAEEAESLATELALAVTLGLAGDERDEEFAAESDEAESEEEFGEESEELESDELDSDEPESDEAESDGEESGELESDEESDEADSERETEEEEGDSEAMVEVTRAAGDFAGFDFPGGAPLVEPEAEAEAEAGAGDSVDSAEGQPNQGEPASQAAEEAEDEREAEDQLEPPEILDAQWWAAQRTPEGAEETCQRLKDKIAAMGEISLAAIERETELTAKRDFHQRNYDDLTKAIADLRNSINRINQTCRELFTKTFRDADAKFREIFPVLFEGGEGWLGLSDENDPLECGVEIHVHPPGKKIMVMSLLSGGEKALTALALIFALYLIKPSPFCLLDEADAPLDEANIDRFNRLLRRLSEASQIIMVTHNKRTMQISDTLYGVTMETPGVSRLVSVNLAQAEVMTDV
ncbi:MAG: AAA family ATPase [Deltaproteobacteria bacterium]|jgi:chromosome segregation protein|nr:AAA family ATPase [Deltaproteobacteria bacterium]